MTETKYLKFSKISMPFEQKKKSQPNEVLYAWPFSSTFSLVLHEQPGKIISVRKKRKPEPGLCLLCWVSSINHLDKTPSKS